MIPYILDFFSWPPFLGDIPFSNKVEMNKERWFSHDNDKKVADRLSPKKSKPQDAGTEKDPSPRALTFFNRSFPHLIYKWDTLTRIMDIDPSSWQPMYLMHSDV